MCLHACKFMRSFSGDSSTFNHFWVDDFCSASAAAAAEASSCPALFIWAMACKGVRGGRKDSFYPLVIMIQQFFSLFLFPLPKV